MNMAMNKKELLFLNSYIIIYLFEYRYYIFKYIVLRCLRRLRVGTITALFWYLNKVFTAY